MERLSFQNFASPERLESVYHEFVASRGIIGRDGTHPETIKASLPELTQRLAADMRDGSHRFTTFRQELILKGSANLPRQISIPTARDQIVLKALSIYLGTVFREAKLEVAQWKVRRLMKEIDSGKFDSFVRVDIESFYPSIPHENLLSTLRWRIEDESAIKLVRSICETQTVPGRSPRPRGNASVGVPQGLSVSNVLAEILMVPVDKSMLANPDIEYFRYVDDVLILCRKESAAEVSRDIRKLLKISGVSAHPEKHGSKSEKGFLANGFDYLGYTLKEDHVSVRFSSCARLENAISRVFTKYRYALRGKPKGGIPAKDWPARCRAICEWRLNLLITGCVFEDNRHGWLQYFSQTNDLKLMKAFDWQVAKHMRKFGLEEHFSPKTFMRSLWAIQHPNRRRQDYVPNFDSMSTDEKRNLLIDIYLFGGSDIRQWSDEKVIVRFQKWMNRLTSELDRDHDPTS